MNSKNNLVQSIKDRLINIAKKRNEDFNHILIHFGLERFLYRLSKSEYADNFILKGAILFLYWNGEMHRITSDIDLLGKKKVNLDKMENIVKEICNIKVEKDGFVFQSQTISGSIIRKEEVSGGIRIKLKAKLGKAIIPIRLDIGFGDAIVPPPKKIKYPTLLNFPAPIMLSYAPETSIAEKFQSMIKMGIMNSRMKDYYDIWFLSKNFEFEGNKLQQAIKETFKKRRTDIPKEISLALSEEFIQDKNKQKQWNGFKNRIGLFNDLTLQNTVNDIKTFLMPVIEALIIGKNINKKWVLCNWVRENKIGEDGIKEILSDEF